ncbi:MAG: DUF4349 domain-containing protein, partial [Dehalococcoidales bacterium]|nr:DUF4349 domain-containing protein [Dehalococcoidales bacterium]
MKKVLFGLMVVLLLFGAFGCAGGQEASENLYSQGNYPYTSTMTQTQTYLSSVPAVTSPGKDTGGYYGDYTTATTDRMVIRNAYLTIVVDDVSDIMTQINALAANFGGYVVNSNIGENKSQLYASITFRVLSENFDATINALHAMAVDVKSETTTGQDVTEEYTDLQSRLRNLEASEAQLLALMERAGTVEEILQVQRELTSTREEIESLKGRMQYLEQSANLALFDVTLEQSKLVVEFTADPRRGDAGMSVYFFPNVTGGFTPYVYEWDFGDGKTSNEEQPTHIYDNEGNFTVTLKVTDDKGTTEEYTRENYITVAAGWSSG